MTNLAYQRSSESSVQINVSYVDFAAHAARCDEIRRRKALCAQHRFGLLLILLCAVSIGISLATTFTDLTAMLLLAPLGVYLLTTKNVILYQH